MFHLQLPPWLTKMFDWGALSMALASFFSWVAPVAGGIGAMLAVVWWCMRIYGQWLENKKLKGEINANE